MSHPLHLFGKLSERSTVSSCLWESLERLEKWMDDNGLAGWDPYDALNGSLMRRLTRGNAFLELAAIQFVKEFPFNIRPALGIKKGIDNKGTALIAQSLAHLYSMTGDTKHKTMLVECMSILGQRSLIQKYGCHCWASHGFSFRGADLSTLSSCVPDTIGTTEVARAFLAASRTLKDQSLMDYAVSACEFLQSRLLTVGTHYAFAKYSLNESNRIVLNASARALLVISELQSCLPDERYAAIADLLAKFILNRQKPNGEWDYSEYSNGTTRRQLDFHQGYAIEGLLEHYKLGGCEGGRDSDLATSIENAARFYIEKQFTREGVAFYRYPRFYPIDIHNQAQGVITFSKLAFLNPAYGEMAGRIAIWTIRNLQDQSGYFYYRKHRFTCNRTPHLRWSQAWMMLALTTLLLALEQEAR